jgi:hypothetical protein
MPPRKQPTPDDTSAKSEDIDQTTERILDYLEQQEPRTHTKEPKVKDAEDFSGLDRGQLRPFLAQCKLVFFAQPSRYATNNAKVYYIASHFKDTALAWWQQQFDLDPMPSWISSYVEFIGKLKEMFGEIDEVGKAERAMRSLEIKSTQTVESYTRLHVPAVPALLTSEKEEKQDQTMFGETMVHLCSYYSLFKFLVPQPMQLCVCSLSIVHFLFSPAQLL